MSDKPLWRQAYDAVDHAVTPRAEELVRTEQFADVSAVAARARSGLRGELDRLTAGIWHLFNLPASSDVQRLRRQIGELDREVRRLRMQLAEQAAHAAERAERGQEHAGPDEHPRPGTP